MPVSVQTEDFNIAQELAQLRGDNAAIGAVALLIGYLRDINEGHTVQAMTLEHYPGMTQRALQEIEHAARVRWPLENVRIVHRYGLLQPTEQIVLVAVASQHRKAAFSACEFIMDFLKTRAPFWKKETTTTGDHWVEAQHHDEEACLRWKNLDEIN